MKDIQINLFSSVKFVDKLVLTKHLAIMIKSGISLADAVNTLRIQSKGTAIGKVLVRIEKDINNGSTLQFALSRFPKVFDEFYVSMVSVGEESGNLEENLEFLADHLSKQDALKKKIQGAMLYPMIVMTAATVMAMVIGLYILPQFVEFFDSFKVELPLATRILLAIANFMQSYGVLFFTSLIGGFFGLGILLNTKQVKPYWHRIMLHIPLFGQIIKYSQLTNFSRNFGILLSSGITVTRSLDTTGNTLSNLLYKEKIKKMSLYLQKGKNLSEAIEKEMSKEFPILVSRMIAVGEKTGNLEETLLYLSDFYEEEIDSLTKKLTTVMEPILLLGIGLVVGFIALAIITPIYELTGSVKR
jgi:type IV pilus assembly protein PilC